MRELVLDNAAPVKLCQSDPKVDRSLGWCSLHRCEEADLDQFWTCLPPLKPEEREMAPNASYFHPLEAQASRQAMHVERGRGGMGEVFSVSSTLHPRPPPPSSLVLTSPSPYPAHRYPF